MFQLSRKKFFTPHHAHVLIIKQSRSLVQKPEILDSDKYVKDFKKKFKQVSKYKNMALLSQSKEKKNTVNTTLENVQSDISPQHDIDKLSADLVHWAVSSKITNNAFSKLLKVLISNGIHHLPQTSSVLYKYQEEDIETIPLLPGKYVHFGMENKLKELVHILLKKKVVIGKEVKLLVFFDNLQLVKQSNHGFWIILGSMAGFRDTTFMIGAYTGCGNPENSNSFLNHFVEEVKHLCSEGFKVHDKLYTIKIERLICDAPAKAFILNIKSFLGYSSCTKCNAEGEYIKNKICLPEKSTLKHDDHFKTNTIYKGNEITKLLEIPNFGVVSNIPLEYMHLVCLGVVKKLVTVWLEENRLTDEVPQVRPAEFSNKLKCLSACKYWSPAQYRQFLLYYGPVIMEKELSPQKYNHFLKLHVACRILCLDSLRENLAPTAENLLNEFVQEFMALYGREHVTHNLHGLYHLTEDCRRHGSLDSFSAFPFEKYLTKLKTSILLTRKKKFIQTVLKNTQEKLFHKSLGALEADQRVLRTKIKFTPSEREMFPKGKSKWTPYKKLKFKNWTLVPEQDGNDHVLLNDGRLIRVLNVLENYNKKRTVFLRGVELSSVSDYYVNPIKSSTVGVYLVGPNESNPGLWPLDSVSRKCIKVSTTTEKRVLCAMMDEEF